MLNRIIFIFLFSYTLTYSQAWQYSGPGQTKEQIKGLFQSVWADSSNLNFVLAGSACGGLFKTENAMDSLPLWENISDTYNGINFGVSNIVVKPNTGNKTIYISTFQTGGGLPLIYGNGILKTINGGKKWFNVGPKAEKENLFELYGLKQNPENENEMIAFSKHHVYVTTDEWQSFKKFELPVKSEKDWTICDAKFAPYEQGKYYISTRTYNYNNAKLFVCSNNGETLKDITPENSNSERIEVATVLSPKFKGKFYMASGNSEVFVYFFDGLRFSPKLNNLAVTQTAGGAYWNLEFEVNQTDTNIMYIGMTEVSRSQNGGNSFDKIAVYNQHNIHADIRGAHLCKSSLKGKNDKLFLANDGGISYLKNCENINWKSLNGEGLNANMFWGIDLAQSDTLLIAGGTQDNGDFLITKHAAQNNIYSCGDGYLSAVINEHSSVNECNAPGLNYWNIKTNQYFYLQVPDADYDAKRPIKFEDSLVIIGHHDLYFLSQKNLENNQTQFKKLTNISFFKNENQSVKNRELKSFDVRNNAAVLSYANPNWTDKNNTGKLFFCESIFKNNCEWKDLTPIAIHGNTLEICRWSEINSLLFDLKKTNTFYFVSRDVFNQTNSHIYEFNYFIDSNKCSITEINYNLPKLGINKIIIDKFSNIMYAGVDDGVYSRDLIKDSLTWHKLNGINNKLPNVMIWDLKINYATNTLYVSAFGRGIYKTQLISSTSNEITVSKNKTENNPVKIDGRLLIEKKKIYTINSKLIITPGSYIYLNKGSKLIVKDKNLIRDENNNIISINNFIKKHKTAQIIFLK